jgi:hypothetical protein
MMVTRLAWMAQAAVLEEADHVGLGGLLEGEQGGRMVGQIALAKLLFLTSMVTWWAKRAKEALQVKNSVDIWYRRGSRRATEPER